MPDTVDLIDVDRRVGEVLSGVFAGDGLRLIQSPTGRDGLALLAERRPDLLLLEVTLPDLDGWSILRRLRRQQAPDLPVIMLTGRRDLQDRVMGLELGADDYIVKPFEPAEVAARVKAVLRRTQRSARPSDVLEFPGLVIDGSGFSVRRAGASVPLSSKEFRLLLTLARHTERVVTRRQLYEAAWGSDDLDDDHVLDVHMNRLRRKLLGADARQYIVTVRGVGYKFVPTAA